jgi:glycerophosphoryl diester phosphodiesterase
VLASDGYPYLKDTLIASEQALQELLQNDPMLFRDYKTTKSVQEGNLSFDDRAYLKILLQ